MIESIVFHNAKTFPKEYSFIGGIKALAGKKFVFTPGLNIIVGPNGSGKSTILSAIANCLAAQQGGASVVTEKWMRDRFGFSINAGNKISLPATVIHDGQSLVYADPRQAIGLSHGGFDDDFLARGIQESRAKGSTGQATLWRIDRALGILLEKEAPPQSIEWKVDKKHVNDLWVQRIEKLEELLAAKCPPGPQTIVLDEPEANLSMPLQYALWRVLSEKTAGRFQVIVASHSPFSLGIKAANYISLEKGYAAAALGTVLEFAERVTAMAHDGDSTK